MQPATHTPDDDLDSGIWRTLSETVQRLEDGWNLGSPVSLAELLPAPGHPFRRRVLLELVKVDQEYRERSGQGKRVEAYLDEWPELGSDTEILMELLTAECLTRATVSTLPTKEELRERFSEIAAEIDLQAIECRSQSENTTPHRWDLDSLLPPCSSDSLAADGEQTSPIEVGGEFGRYQIRSLLGEGGMGWVYRAYDTKLQRDVALKIPRFSQPADAELVRRFCRESHAAARIEHRNVCTVYDTGEINGVPYITMRLARGQSLAKKLQDGPLQAEDAARLAHKLAEALQAIHAGRILHRDVKPSNVLMDETGEPLLTDFGLAKFRELGDGEIPITVEPSTGPQAGIDTEVESNTGPVPTTGNPVVHTAALIGTIPYMAPELFDDRPPDERSDIYSLGVVMYRMLTGRLPFTGQAHELLNAIRSLAPVPPSRLRACIPPELEAICLKAIQKDPAHRYQSAEEMARALGDIRPHSTPDTAGRRRFVRHLLTVVGAAAALVLLGLLMTASGDKIPTLKIARRIETSPHITGLEFSGDGGTLHTAHSLYGLGRPSLVQGFDVQSGQRSFESTATKIDCDHKALVVAADGRYAYVTNYLLHFITRIDLRNPDDRADLRISTMDRGNWSCAIRITPDQSKLVVMTGGDGGTDNNGQLSIVDIADGRFELAGEVMLPGETGVHMMDVSADSRFAYVLCRFPDSGTDTHTIPHTDTLFEVRLDPPYENARDPLSLGSVNPIGLDDALSLCAATRLGKLFICEEKEKRIRVIDTEHWAPVADFRVQDYHPSHVALNPRDAMLAVVCRRARKVFLISAIDGSPLAQVKGIRDTPSFATFSPDGQWLYVVDGLESSVAMIDVQRALAQPGIVFASNRRGEGYQVFRANPDGKRTKRITTSTGNDTSPRWSPEGRRIGFLTDRDGPRRIAITGIDGGEVRVFEATDPVSLHRYAGITWDWSPDGREIAFVGGTHRAIRIVDVQSGQVRTVLHGPVEDRYDHHRSVCWSDRDRILFVTHPRQHYFDRTIFVVNPLSGELRRLVDGEDGARNLLAPSVSPDGRLIAALRQPAGPQPEDLLLLLDAHARLLDTFAIATPPPTGRATWSADSRHLLFSAGPEGAAGIYRLDLQSHAVVSLITGKGDQIEPDLFGSLDTPEP